MSAEGSHFDRFFCIQYIICECGKTFPSADYLKSHHAKEHPHKRERKEYKCGVCGSIFETEEGCITHYEQNHITNDDVKEEHLDNDSENTKPHIKTDLPKLEVEVNADEENMYHVGDEVIVEEVIDEEVVNEEVVMAYEEDGEQVLHIPEELGHVMQNKDGKLVLFVNKQSKNATTEILHNKNDSKHHMFTAANEYLRRANIKMGLPFHRSKKSSCEKKTGNDESNGQELDAPKTKTLNNIVCEVCGKHYWSSAALRYHQRVHTGEKPYACNYCPKRFTMPFFLKIHLRIHTGERPYLCPHCPKAFYSKAALLRHIRVHTGEKPYPCPMCSKSFAQSNAMKLHITTVHLKQPAFYKSAKRKTKAEGNKNEPKPKVYKQTFANPDSDPDEDELVYEVIESEGNTIYSRISNQTE